MKLDDGKLRLSASDLVGILNCRHLTVLDRMVAMGELAKPFVWDPSLEVLRERGYRHEAAYLDHLRSQGIDLVTVPDGDVSRSSACETLAAMRRGVPVIVQGVLRNGQWAGRTDVLLRVEQPSELGSWSYEVVDTKLARDTKAGTILQLALYSDLLAQAQGRAPELMHVIAPWREFERESWRTSDFAAFYRKVKGDLEHGLSNGLLGSTYPEPNPHCDVCRWRFPCDEQRRGDDHLSVVAGMGRSHSKELCQREITTVAALAALPVPLTWKPAHGSAASYERLADQARLQVIARETGEPRIQLLPVEPGLGLSRLPEPSPGDVFLDFEGDPFVGQHGLEYLHGFYFCAGGTEWTYRGLWALDREAEKAAFEEFVDFVLARWNAHPGMHIYHYGGYETGALKRLAGRYATREEELDRLLRGNRLVDLLTVVRQGLRASVESYSIKMLEPFYDFVRDADLPDANLALRRLESSLELDEGQLDDTDRATVERYNRDDCVSTQRLRDWLEQLRGQVIASGTDMPRPAPSEPEPGENHTAWLERIAPLVGA